MSLPKSNSWLPGAKMSGRIMLVSVMMWAPRSSPDINDGDSVSPACANTTWLPSALARSRSAFTTAASRAKPPRRLPSGIILSPMM